MVQEPDTYVGPAYIEILQDFSSDQFIGIEEQGADESNDSALSEYINVLPPLSKKDLAKVNGSASVILQKQSYSDGENASLFPNTDKDWLELFEERSGRDDGLEDLLD